MVVKSVFTVISVNKTKIAYIGAQKALPNFGEKKGGGNQKFSKILGGNQSLKHYEEDSTWI